MDDVKEYIELLGPFAFLTIRSIKQETETVVVFASVTNICRIAGVKSSTPTFRGCTKHSEDVFLSEDHLFLLEVRPQ